MEMSSGEPLNLWGSKLEDLLLKAKITDGESVSSLTAFMAIGENNNGLEQDSQI